MTHSSSWKRQLKPRKRGRARLQARVLQILPARDEQGLWSGNSLGPLRLVRSTLALKPVISDDLAMNTTAPAASSDKANGISCRAALGLGVTLAAGVLLSPEWLAVAPAKRRHGFHELTTDADPKAA